MIRHVVMWQLKATDPAEKVDVAHRIRDDFRTLPPLVKEIRALQVGINVLHVDRNFDVVLIADFHDLAALELYLQHPAHQKVAAYVRSVTSDRRAIDFEV